MTLMTTSIAEFKKEFSDREGIQMNSAGLSLISKRVAMKVISSITEHQRLGSDAAAAWTKEFKNAREVMARFLGAEVSEVAFTLNCAASLSQAALGFPLTSNDAVVIVDQEYASNYYPWKTACERAQATLNVITSEPNRQIDSQKLLAAIVPGVRLVAISWVQFQTGTITDLKKLGDHCHSVGAYLVVDGIQGLGQLPFSFKDLPVDFVAGGSQKWMTSVNGQGFFAVKKEFMEQLKPLLIGSTTFNRNGMGYDESAKIETSARKFEPGGLGIGPVAALAEAASLLLQVGIDQIADEISRLSLLLRQGLRANPKIELITPFDQRGGTTSFKLPIDLEVAFLRRCREEGIAVAKRGDLIRISLHAFVTDAEIEKVLTLLQA